MKISKIPELSDEDLNKFWWMCRELVQQDKVLEALENVQLLIAAYKELREHHVEETTELWRRLQVLREAQDGTTRGGEKVN